VLPVSIVEAKGIYGFKKELGTTEDRFRGRRRDSNTTAKLEPLIVRERRCRGKDRSAAALYVFLRHLLLPSMTDWSLTKCLFHLTCIAIPMYVYLVIACIRIGGYTCGYKACVRKVLLLGS